MITNFKAELEGMLFEFKTIYVVKLQLFQVYVAYAGRKIRFHMQQNPSGTFYITDPNACPEVYRVLEPDLNQLILAHSKLIEADY
jgi:hypothetical protein